MRASSIPCIQYRLYSFARHRTLPRRRTALLLPRSAPLGSLSQSRAAAAELEAGHLLAQRRRHIHLKARRRRLDQHHIQHPTPQPATQVTASRPNRLNGRQQRAPWMRPAWRMRRRPLRQSTAQANTGWRQRCSVGTAAEAAPRAENSTHLHVPLALRRRADRRNRGGVGVLWRRTGWFSAMLLQRVTPPGAVCNKGWRLVPARGETTSAAGAGGVCACLCPHAVLCLCACRRRALCLCAAMLYACVSWAMQCSMHRPLYRPTKPTV